MKKNLLVLPVLVSACMPWPGGPSPARTVVPAISAGDAGKWRADITFLADTLFRGHAAAFHRTPEPEFRREVARVLDAIPRLARHEAIVEVSRLYALAGDGHTLSWAYPFDWNREELGFRLLPLQWEAVGRDIVVWAAPHELAELVGTRLRRVGSHSAEQVVAALAPIISRDNEHGLYPMSATYLRVPEVLHARGVSGSLDSVRVELEWPDGRRAVRWLKANRPDSVNAVDVFALQGSVAPLHLRHRDRYYWHEAITERSTTYLQVNAMANASGASLGQYCSDVVDEALRLALRRIIVDLRYNGGGSRETMLPCIAKIRESAFNAPGRLIVLIGHDTFSAALWAALDFERQTAAVLIGQPTKGKPNFYGETRRVQSPNLKLRGVFASRMNIRSDSTDTRDSLEPHVSVGLDWRAHVLGQDPTLAAALAYENDAPRRR